MKDKINRMNKKEGGFMTVSNDIMYDKKLSSSARDLLILMLNNSSEWELNTTYFGNKLGWSPSRLSKATKLLIELGYLERTLIGDYNGKGTIYKYIVNEVPIFDYRSSVTEVQLPNVSNRSSVTEVRKQYVNNTNLDNTNLDNTNLNKTKLNNTNRAEAEAVTIKEDNINKELNINKEKTASATEPIKEVERKKFFFNVGEKPTQERVIQFAEEKGYPKEVGARIHSSILQKNFKDKNGTEIKYMDAYLSLLLKDESKEPPIKQEALIEVENEFVKKVDSMNRRYVARYKERNSNHNLENGLLSMKDAARLFFRTVGRTEGEYRNRIVKYMESGGNTVLSPHSFKKFIQGNTEEIVQPSIGENEREDKFIYVPKDVPTEEIERKGTSYLDR